MCILPCLFLKTMSWKMIRKSIDVSVGTESISFRSIGIEGCVNDLKGFLKQERTLLQNCS